MITTDYLVIGAGAASLAFCDTLLVEQPNATITIVDKKSAPGGHWNDAYGHVNLHQPSLLYGTQSDQLEGNWLWLLLRHQTFFFNHRASKEELLSYYQNWMTKWINSGRVVFLPNSEYDFKASSSQEMKGSKTHKIISTTTNGEEKTTIDIRVHVKLVNATLGECRIPSLCKPQFPIGSVKNSVITPNELFDMHQKQQQNSGWKIPFWSRFTTENEKQHYVVMGAGKTAMDAVVFLQREMGVSAKCISWIIPNDVWMLRREGPGLPGSWPLALLEKDLDAKAAALYLEKTTTAFTRLDEQQEPTKYRFPVIGKDEMAYLRQIPKENIIRRGRVTAIDNTTVSFAKGESINFATGTTHFVHCTSPGPFNGNTEMNLFPSDDLINLWLVYAPPVPISLSTLAILESRRVQGLLDLDFGRQLCGALLGEDDDDNKAKAMSDTQVLNTLVRGYPINGDDVTSDAKAQVMVLVTDAAVLAIMDKDPLVALAWQKQNRLSTRSIPGQKANVYETLQTMEKKADILGLTQGELRMVQLLATKLKVLEGK